MTAGELRALGSKWQERLDLSRYNLHINFDKRMKNKDGRVFWDEDVPSIHIKIRGSLVEENIEETIVHEFLHPLFQIEEHNPIHEGAFNVIARALVKNNGN